MQKLSDALATWPDWGVCSAANMQPPSLIEIFDAGKNHTTALVKCAEQSYVLKLFDHSFEHAISRQKWAANLNLAPTIHYAKNPIALMDYVASSVPSLSATATALRKLHTQTPPCLEAFDFLGFCTLYLSNADRQTRNWHTRLLPLLNEYIKDPTPKAFCHNDLVVENCMGCAENTVFIDWEYAQLNNPWFDLAAIVVYYQLADKQAMEFLNHYRDGWGAKVEQRIFLLSQLALLWGDLLWHIHKFGVDYRSQHPQRFAQVVSLAQALGLSL